jgi:DNA-binding GntR family transcriptional regulator
MLVWLQMEGRPRSGNIQDLVYTNLRKRIINLNLEPGRGISEKEVAVHYNVSRTPVRETFIHLAKEGLVQVIPQKETVVSLIDFSRVEQEFFLRESLEIAVLEHFIAKSKDQDFFELEKLIKMQIAALDKNEYIDFVEHDDDFHRTFFRAAGQELSWDVLQNMSGHYHRVRLLTIRLNGIAGNIMEQHTKLFAALKSKDAKAARDNLKLHLNKIASEEKMLRAEFPEYFVRPNEGNVFEADFAR